MGDLYRFHANLPDRLGTHLISLDLTVGFDKKRCEFSRLKGTIRVAKLHIRKKKKLANTQPQS